MVRPSDLPKPVRAHQPHEDVMDRLRKEASPGPARYSGHGVTEIDKDKRLGFFPRAKRFSDGTLSRDDHPGPKYNPSLNSTRIPIGFSSTSHISSSPSRTSTGGTAKRSASCPLVPGPGDYHTELSWSKGVTLPASGRPRVVPKDSTPGPGEYSPVKPPKRERSARMGVASSHQKMSELASMEGPKHTSLEAMDQALSVTRPSTCAVSFPKSGRGKSTSTTESIDNLPHAYDLDRSDAFVKRYVRGGVFSKSKRIKEHRPDTDGRLVALPPPDADSNHTTAPRISFAKSAYSRGVPSKGDEIPTAKYYPQMEGVSPAVKGVLSWGKPHRSASGGKDNTTTSYAAGVQYMEAKSTLAGPQYSFGSSKRPPPHPTSQAPVGPGSYNPPIVRRREAPSVGFAKSKRDGLEAVLKEHKGESDGPMYSPNYFVGHPSQSGVSISRAPRKLRLGDGSSGPDTMYNPQFAQTRPNERSGVLYLTG